MLMLHNSKQIYEQEKLFMWMLRDITTKISVEEIVYVNGTWYPTNIYELENLFM
jgi:hypothetical protein